MSICAVGTLSVVLCEQETQIGVEEREKEKCKSSAEGLNDKTSINKVGAHSINSNNELVKIKGIYYWTIGLSMRIKAERKHSQYTHIHSYIIIYISPS